MIKKIITLFLILFPINSYALIEVDITRGNLDPLPVAVSPLSIDEKSRKSFEKVLKKKKYWRRNFKYCRKYFEYIRII